jgi:SAM-dependent methyltransferase
MPRAHAVRGESDSRRPGTAEWGAAAVGDYTRMSASYDLIMTSGYYDYDAIVEALAPPAGTRSVLELGAGTGLVLERLAARHPDLDLAGVDLTQAMLDIATTRLAGSPRVSLHRQDVVALGLERQFDLAFSYGGVWYFVPDGPGLTMVSHLRDDDANAEGLRRVADHLVTGGLLRLGIQAPHADYSAPVRGGLTYSQRIAPLDGGFRKHYRLDPPGGDGPVMEQTTDYRTYGTDDALALLDKAGFDARPDEASPLFLTFGRR